MDLTFGFILFPDMTQLDLTGPFEVFAQMPGVTTHLLWKTLDPVRTDSGLTLTPTATFEECPALDRVCVREVRDKRR
jgi:cyclohexyl-isocyanide hydratase